MAIKVLHDNVLVRKEVNQNVDENGIFIPTTNMNPNKPVEGIAAVVGNGVRDINGKLVPLTVSAGDYIVYTPYSGVEVTIGEDKYMMIKERDVIAILTEDKVDD